MSKNGEEQCHCQNSVQKWMKDLIFHRNDLIFHSSDVLPYTVVFDSLQIVCFFSIYNLMCFKFVFFFNDNKGAYIYFLSPPLFIQTVHTLWSPTMENPIFMYMFHFFGL